MDTLKLNRLHKQIVVKNSASHSVPPIPDVPSMPN